MKKEDVRSKFSPRLDQSEHYEDVQPIVVQGRARSLQSILRCMTREDLFALSRLDVYDNAGAPSLEDALNNVNSFELASDRAESAMEVHQVVNELQQRQSEAVKAKQSAVDNSLDKSSQSNNGPRETESHTEAGFGGRTPEEMAANSVPEK